MYKIGDKLKRLKEPFHNMKIGTIGTVETANTNSYTFKEFGGRYSTDNYYWELISTSTFKIGDKVRRKKDTGINDKFNPGDIGEIITLLHEEVYNIKISNNYISRNNHERCIELVEETKALPFKEGDIVKCIRASGSLKYNHIYNIDKCYKETNLLMDESIYISVSGNGLKESGGWDFDRFELVKSSSSNEIPLSIWELDGQLFLIAQGESSNEKALISLRDGKAYKFPKPNLLSNGYKYGGGMFNDFFVESELDNVESVEDIQQPIAREIFITTESSHLLQGYETYINDLIEGKKK